MYAQEGGLEKYCGYLGIKAINLSACFQISSSFDLPEKFTLEFIHKQLKAFIQNYQNRCHIKALSF